MPKTGRKTWFVLDGTTTLIDFSTAFVDAPAVNGVGFKQATVAVDRLTAETFNGVARGDVSRYGFAQPGDVLMASQVAWAAGVASSDAVPAPPAGPSAPSTGGSGGPVTVASITDATAVGKSILTAADAASARSALGAGTSNVTVGTGASDAKAGNYTPTWGQVTSKPSFATVATSGAYTDLTKPAGGIPASDLDAKVALTPFAPTALPGLVGWYRTDELLAAGAADGAGVGTGTTVWKDASGAGNHLAAAVRTADSPQNTYYADAASTGRPGVKIANGFYIPAANADPLADLTGSTLVVATVPASTNAAGGFVFGSQGRMRLYNQAAKFGICSSSAYPYESGTSLTAGGRQVLTGLYDGAKIRGRVNGTEVVSTNQTGTLATSAGTSKLTLGVQDGSNAYVYDGFVFEAVIYNRTLTATELTQVEAYMAARMRSTSIPAISTAATAQSVTLTAAALVDSIGLNIHDSYNDTVYAQPAGNANELLRTVLRLGVTRLRCGAKKTPQSYVPAFINAAVDAGIKFTMTFGSPTTTSGDWVTGESASLVNALKAAPYVGKINQLELTNEWDLNGGGSWAANLRTYVSEFYAALKADATLSAIPVLGPSMANAASYATYGADTTHADAVNIHPYSGAAIPEGAFLDTWISSAQTIQGTGKPVIATEFGWHNALNTGNSVDEQTAADYLIRSLIWNLSKGISQSFAYELFDQKPNDVGLVNSQQHYGLVAVVGDPSTPSTWVQREKPAYAALRNLIARMKDPSTGTAPTSLGYAVTAGPSDLAVVSIGRKDGSFDLAVWRKASLWSGSNRNSVPGLPVRLSFLSAFAVEAYRPHDGTLSVLSPGTSATTVIADAQMTLLRLRKVS
jgi:hypothetical protein